MSHKAEIDTQIHVETVVDIGTSADVIFLSVEAGAVTSTIDILTSIVAETNDGVEVVLYGEMHDLARIHASIPREYDYHLCVAVKCEMAISAENILPRSHLALLFYGKRTRILSHAKVRIAYEYCLSCGKTTKDYGGRKHLYHEYGTLMSDVWKDICVRRDDIFPSAIVDRVRDMMSVNGRKLMVVSRVHNREKHDVVNTHSLYKEASEAVSVPCVEPEYAAEYSRVEYPNGTLYCGDALNVLRNISSNSAHLAFADPPYNLAKNYKDYRDRRDIHDYFEWCDQWLAEYLRILKPGGFLAVLNIPIWAMRHLSFLDRRATLVNWVVWEAMSMPVRLIMPSNYALLIYQKEPLLDKKNNASFIENVDSDDLKPLAHGYCRRAACIRKRKNEEAKSRLNDMWSDIDRIKHNSLRWDHPCQLPPRLMRRVILCTTTEGDTVFDAFNGIGTTSLVAAQLRRRFIGVELSVPYHNTSVKRHEILNAGGDPFAKRSQTPETKNNNVRRQGTEAYEVSKKALQLAVKDLSKRLGKIPTKEDVKEYLPYPMRYFDIYFKSWSEVVAAARTTGMSELPPHRCMDNTND